MITLYTIYFTDNQINQIKHQKNVLPGNSTGGRGDRQYPETSVLPCPILLIKNPSKSLIHFSLIECFNFFFHSVMQEIKFTALENKMSYMETKLYL